MTVWDEDYWEDKPDPTDEQLAEVARGWLNYQATKDEEFWWAAEAVMESSAQLALGWRVLLAILAEVDPGDRDRLIDIGCGPIESLIFRFGDEFVDLVEAEIPRTPLLLQALTAVCCWDEPARPRIDRILAEHGLESC
jgi:hypothetical protein